MIDSFYTSMTLRLIRAGSRGEHEQKFLDEGRVYVAWEGLDVDLSLLADRQDLIRVLEERFPDEKAKALVNWSSQVWPFVKDMAQGDWVVMPSKLQSGLYFGELTSNYHFEAAGPNPCYHWRSINWFSGLIPRTVFPQDLLYSFGAFMTICRLQRNDAEARVKAMAVRNWQMAWLRWWRRCCRRRGQAGLRDDTDLRGSEVRQGVGTGLLRV